MKSNQNLKLYFLFISFNIFFSIHAHAGNFTWNGSSDATWYRSTNWSPIGIPVATDSVTISSTAAYNLILDSNKTVYRFIISGDTVDFGGKILTVSNSSSLSGGYLTNGTFEARGSSVTFSGTTFNVTVSAICTSILFNGSTFNYTVEAEIIGSSVYTSSGGNTFNSTFLITNNTSNGTINLANTSKDYFNSKVTVVNTGRNPINFALNDTTFFNDSIVVNSTNGGIAFGSTNGIAVLASGKKLVVGSTGFSKGTLLLNRFIQLGSTAQSLSLTGSAIISFISSTFNGTVTYSAPGILVKKSTFNSAVYFTKTDSISNVWYGENTYSGVFRFTNNGSGSVQMQTSVFDIFADSATINAGSAAFTGAVSEHTYFYNNLYTTGSNISFNSGDGTLRFAGTANQIIKGTIALPIKNLIIDKSSGTLTLQTPVTISNNLNLTNGILVTDTTNILTILHGAGCSSASNASFVSGPVKKTGNASFTFPIGKGNSMNIAGISSPASSTDSYMAEYFEDISSLPGDSLDSSVTSISTCGYWKIERITGSSNVKITLGWDTIPCIDFCDTLAKMAVWKSSKWQKINIDTVTTNTNNVGRFVSSANVSDFGYFLVANVKTPLIRVNYLTPGRSINDYFGLNVWDVVETNVTTTPGDYLDAVKLLSPATLRWPAGIEANWWDWKRGRFIKDRTIGSTHYYLPEQFQDKELESYNGGNGLPYQMTDFYQSAYHTGCTPFFSVNDLSSDVLYQTTMLYDSRKHNIPVQLLEFGGEIYKVADYNDVTFPTGTVYANSAIDWGIKMKSLFMLTPTANTTDFQIGLCASRYKIYNDTERTLKWNSNMFNALGLQSDFIPDAIILHDYIGAGMTKNPPDRCGTGAVNSNGFYELISPFAFGNCTNDMELVFASPFRSFLGDVAYPDYKGFKNEELDASNISTNPETVPGKFDIWITEYNFNEQFSIFHGSWAHGLCVALQTMLYLESERITKVNCFKLLGDGISAAVFGNNNGFNYDSDKKPSPFEFDPSPSTLPTDDLTPTATGYTLGLLAKAMRNADHAVQLNFFGGLLPRFSEYKRYGSISAFNEPQLYGWLFVDSSGFDDQIIILNLSDKEVSIDAAWSLPISTVNAYEQIFCDPAAFILSESTNFNGDNDHPLTIAPEITFSPTQNILLAPYSIMRLYNKSCNVVLKSQWNRVCAGSTSSLSAYSYPGYTYSWTISSTTGLTSTTEVTTPTGRTLIFDVDPLLATNQTIDFTVTIDNGSGCTSTASQTITILKKPTLEIKDQATSATVPSGIVVCSPTNLLWDAILSSANYHCILINSNGEGVAESDNASTTLDFVVDTSATYYVYAFDGSCVVESEPIDITVPWLDLPDKAYVCDGNDYSVSPLQVPLQETIETPVDPGDIGYIWSGGSTIANPTFANITTTTTVTVTMTYINTAGDPCVIMDEIILYPVACCTTATDHTFYDPTITELIALYGTPSPNGTVTVTGQDIGINGILNITGYNLRFTDCTIHMGEAAEIVVDRHFVLTLDGTTIEACGDKMWKGVRLLESATIKQQNNPSEINDAEYAIQTSYRSRVYLDDFDAGAISFTPYLTMRRNYISLYVPPAPANTTNDLDLRIGNMLITDDNVDLLDPYIDQAFTITNASRSYAGMILNDIIGVVGLNNGIKNRIQFDGLNNGIIVNNSNLMVINSTFNNILPDATIIAGNGIGIKASGTLQGNYSLTQEGLGKFNTDATFNNCIVGIVGNRISLDISRNKMTGVSNGIQSFMGQYRNISIFKNNISCKHNGIIGSYNNWANKFEIYDNEIHVDNSVSQFSNASGIAIYEFPSSNNIIGNKIYNNEIYLEHGQHGILLNTTLNSNVTANPTIEMNDDNINSNGIYLNTCDNASVWFNDITGSGTTSQTGIRTYQTINSVLRSNTTDHTATGLYFDQDCNNTWMHCNHIITHDIGAMMDDGGMFGHKHIMEGNKWEISGGTYSGNGFNYIGLDAFGDQFTAYQFSTQWPDPINPLTGFFNGGPNYDPCVNPLSLRCIFYDADSIISTGNISMELYEDEYNFMAKMNLYSKADAYPDSVPAEGVIDSFYTANENTTIGLFNALNRKAKSLFILTEPATETIDVTDSLVTACLKKMAYNDSLRNETINASDSLALIDENNALRNSISQALITNNEMMHEIDSLNNYYTDSLADENSTISITEQIEENLYDVNDIYYSTLAKGIYEFDSLQTITLYNIGIQCPKEGGKAVLLAQGIYHLINDTLVFNSDTCCQQPSPRLGNKENPQSTSVIFPNPAINAATLKYSLPEKKDGLLIITDILNREIIRVQLSSKLTTYWFSCERFNSGIYMYSIMVEGELSGYGKFCLVN